MPNFSDYVAFRDEQVKNEAAKVLKATKKSKDNYLDNLGKHMKKDVYQNDYKDVAYGQSFKGE